MKGKFDPSKVKLTFDDPPIRQGKKVEEFDMEAQLVIDPTQLDKELIEQPSKFAWVASLHEYAKDLTQQEKMSLEELKAELDTEVRIEANQQETKITEAMVRNLVLQDKRFKKANEHYLETQKLSNLLGVAVQAFHMRANMLISLSANKRMELDTEITTLTDMMRQKKDKGRKEKES